MSKQVQRGLVAAGVLVASSASQAAITLDLTEVTGANAQILLVGAAVFAIAVAIKVYKWARRAL